MTKSQTKKFVSLGDYYLYFKEESFAPLDWCCYYDQQEDFLYTDLYLTLKISL